MQLHPTIPNRKVLLIEDSPFWQTVLKCSLQNVDDTLEITTFRNAEEFGQTKNDVNRFDLIISDHFLGGAQTGLEFWRELSAKNLRTPFLLTSGVDENRFLDLINDDFDHPHFIEKSLVGGHFSDRVRGLLNAPVTAAPIVGDDYAYFVEAQSMRWLMLVVSTVATASLCLQISTLHTASVTLQPPVPSQVKLKVAPLLLNKSAPHLEAQAKPPGSNLPMIRQPAHVETNTESTDGSGLKDVTSPELKRQVAEILRRADEISADAMTSLRKNGTNDSQ